jgi:hypothetical protein
MHHTHRRRSPSLLIGLVGLFVALIAATGASSAHAEVTPGTYVISPLQDTRKALDVAGASVADGAPVNQFTFHGGSNQRWRITVIDRLPLSGTPVYRLRAVHSNKCLDVPGASQDAGVDLAQFTCHTGQNQQFFIDDTIGSRAWGSIIPRHSGLPLQIQDASLLDGAHLEQNLGPFAPAPFKAHQRFALLRVG